MSTNTKTTSNQFVDPSMPVAPPVGGYESSKLYAYNAPSRNRLDESKLTKEQLKKKQDAEKIDKMIEYDAHNNVSSELALHYDEDNNPDEGAPLGKEAVVIDSKVIRDNILNDVTLTSTGKMRLNRAVEILEDLNNQGMSMVRDQNKNYWIESVENGERYYSKSAIQEVKLLIDKYSVKAPAPAPATTTSTAPTTAPEAGYAGTLPDATMPQGGSTIPVGETAADIAKRKKAAADQAAAVQAELARRQIARKQRSNTIIKNHSVKTKSYGVFELSNDEENRAISMLVDLGGSAIAAVPTPATKVIGAVTSLGATIADTVMDYNDPNVSSGQMATNLGMGLASTGASMLTGPMAKFASLAKNTKKLGTLLKYAHNVAVLNGMWDVTAGLKDISNKIQRGEALGAEDLGTFVKVAHLAISGGATRAAKKKLVAKVDAKRAEVIPDSKTYKKQQKKSTVISKRLDDIEKGSADKAKTALANSKTPAQIETDRKARIGKLDTNTTRIEARIKQRAEASKKQLLADVEKAKKDPKLSRGQKAAVTRRVNAQIKDLDTKIADATVRLQARKTAKTATFENQAAAAKQNVVDIGETRKKEQAAIAKKKADTDAVAAQNKAAEELRVKNKEVTRTEAALSKTEKDIAEFTSERSARRERRSYEEREGLKLSAKYGSKEYTVDKLTREKKILEAKVKKDPTNNDSKDKLVSVDKKIKAINTAPTSMAGKGYKNVKQAGNYVANKTVGGVDRVTSKFGRNTASGSRAQYVYENKQSANTPGSEEEIDAQLEAAGVEKSSLKNKTMRQKVLLLSNIKSKTMSKDPMLKRRLGGILEARVTLIPKATNGIVLNNNYFYEEEKKKKAKKKEAEATGGNTARTTDIEPKSRRGDNNIDSEKGLSGDALKYDNDKKLVEGHKTKKPSSTFTDILEVLGQSHIRPSDFLPSAKSKMFINRLMPKPLRAKYINLRSEQNLPGYQQAMNSMLIPQKVDSADYMQVREATNTANRVEGVNTLAAKNAEYRMSQDEANDRIRDANIESAIATDNANTTAENEALQQIADAENRAAAARYEDRAKRSGRLLDGIVNAGKAATKINQRRSVAAKYADLAKLNNIWVTEYKDRYDTATTGKQDAEAMGVIADFIRKHNVNPLEISTRAAELKNQSLSLM